MRRQLIMGLFACGIALVLAGCKGTATTTTPTTDVTETFTGTVNPGGGTTHVFTVSTKGTVTATLTAVGDDNSRVIGVSMGNWTGTVCNLSVVTDFAVITIPVSATVSAAATLCVRVYDSQGVPDATTYTLTVVHP